MTVQTHVCVIGAGTMGRGIAQVALAAGHPVTLVDPQDHQLEAARTDIAKRLSRRSPDIADTIDERLRVAESIVDARPTPDTLVIEAVLESLDVKTDVLSQAAAHFGPQCILATNTSSLSVTAIAAGSSLPERVVGMHFFNPVPVMKLVEVVSGIQTDPEVADRIAALARAWGKDVALVKSSPGFIVNRVARGFYGEALRLLEEHVAAPQLMDEVFRSAGGFRMGPFELMDLIGNDVNAAVTRSVWTAFNFDPRFEPSRRQDELVAAGHFGRKSGRGFYRYEDGSERSMPTPAQPGSLPDYVVLRGKDALLEQIVRRAGIYTQHVPDTQPSCTLPDGTLVLPTRGVTAAAESAARGGHPVVVLDRCLDPERAKAVAIAESHSGAKDAMVALLQRAGLQAYEVEDAPGLVLARTLAVIANEAWETALHGVASPEDIDVAMETGTNYPSGPFSWTRTWGPDVVLELLDNLWSTYHDTRYRANRLLRAEASRAGAA